MPSINSYPDAQITIYNRRGEVVFYSKGYQSPFDGKVKGLMQPSGVYVYSIKLDETSAIKNGTLMLLN
ncbi:gliding motility-associated C-terminal domain-containing protein [Dyadobacter sp. 32]|uniref:T9SS type B sorting domain-containing protein n=1 Tax=Dyadobacter sp. 32 TaxID=538966 RepID=UPI0039C5FC63